MTQHPVLYSFRRCPYAMRARLALAAAEQTCELREVVLSRKPDELRQVSAKATVPVLVDINGQVVEESFDIMLWALHRHDPMKWLPGDGAMAGALQWVRRCDGEFKHQLDRYKYPSRFDIGDRCEPRQLASSFLADLNQHLGQSPCLTGGHWGMVDAALAPFVRQFAHTDSGWFASQSWPELQAWLSAFEASDLFKSIMTHHAPWHAGQQKILLFT
ncbi:MAG: glutathione S-transferase [Rhodoferax sp.]|uniref:glutathione S-transferase n=1 Tax=Rhodoferax sp. TaxID=50421 RepID=UPI002621178C|nr:glutathione S-transferase [Rhodoferax sp.]MDD2881340.1 glutathione S-transferase [Rhodoferax sp.]